MLYIIELEPLKERYTSWWSTYIPNKIKSLGIECKVISGEPLTSEVKTGTVLDAGSTNFFKSTQLETLSEMFYNKEIKPYDTFLVTDIWFPGIEMIRYMSQLYNIPVKIYGVWHAGSSTMGDFAEPMHSWSKYFEVGFLNMCDGIFVGSEYSKSAIIDRLLYIADNNDRNSIINKIHAYGMPIDFQMLQKFDSPKENIILFPHRPDPEKNPNIFIDIIYGLRTFWEEFENYKFIFCTSKREYISKYSWINALLGSIAVNFKNVEIRENLEKEDYYKLLGKSKLMISTTMEENFGYCAVEALAMGTHILVPNAFSYPEITDDNYNLLYNDYDELMAKIIKCVNEPANPKELKELVVPYSETIRKWVEIMK